VIAERIEVAVPLETPREPPKGRAPLDHGDGEGPRPGEAPGHRRAGKPPTEDNDAWTGCGAAQGKPRILLSEGQEAFEKLKVAVCLSPLLRTTTI
jgi:hypothetical protein